MNDSNTCISRLCHRARGREGSNPLRGNYSRHGSYVSVSAVEQHLELLKFVVPSQIWKSPIFSGGHAPTASPLTQAHALMLPRGCLSGLKLARIDQTQPCLLENSGFPHEGQESMCLRPRGSRWSAPTGEDRAFPAVRWPCKFPQSDRRRTRCCSTAEKTTW